MPDGELRRPPQLWEQRLARVTSVLGVGLSSSAATAIVPPQPPPGAGGGTEPAPVLPPPGDFIKPSTPTLLSAVQGINVLWDGLNSAGDLWPYDTSWVEVHMSTAGTAFTVGTATLQGRLARPGGLYVGGLTAGTTYYFRLQGVDPAGNVTEASDAASGQTGLTTASDYGTATIGSGAVSFDARQIGGVTSTVGTAQPSNPVVGDIWLDTTGGSTTHKRWNGTSWETILFGSGSIADSAITTVKIDQSAITEAKLSNNAVVASKIAAGAINADKIAANAITGDKIAANTITSSLIAANTITATNIATGAITAGAIAASAITAEKIQAGAVTTDKLTAGTITGFYISGGTINGGVITGGTIEGSRFQTSGGSSRVSVRDNIVLPFTTGDGIEFFGGSTSKAQMAYNNSLNQLFIYCDSVGITNYNNTGTGFVEIVGDLEVSDGLTVDGPLDANGNTTLGASGANAAFRVQNDDVFSYGIDDNTTASAANVRVGASAQLLKSTSTVRLKDELAPLDDDLTGVPPEKLSKDPPSVDPYDVLTLTPTEFRSLSPADSDARALGFIAEDVAAKFPWAANWDDEGLPSAIEDRPIIAALVAVIKDLRARIEALEA